MCRSAQSSRFEMSKLINETQEDFLDRAVAKDRYEFFISVAQRFLFGE